MLRWSIIWNTACKISWNFSGVVLLFALVVFFSYSGSDLIFFSPRVVLFLIGGVVLLAAERLWGRSSMMSTFILSSLWVGYWSVAAYYTYIFLGLGAFVASVAGHGGGLFFWLFLGTFLFFVCLVIANLMMLFLIPKPESKL